MLIKQKNNVCLSCLECCKNISLPMNYKGKVNHHHYEEFAKTRNIKLVKVKDDKIYFLIPYPCPYLTDEGCSVYEDRPSICRMYNGRFDPALEDTCEL